MEDSYYDNLSTYESKVNVNSEAYRENYKKMTALVEKLNLKLSEVKFEGEAKYIERSRSSGKFLGRERCDYISFSLF
jgi:hypothetical protein